MTDPPPCDILQSAPGWRGANDIRSVETAQIHHVAQGRRSRGSRSHYRFNYFFTRHPSAWEPSSPFKARLGRLQWRTCLSATPSPIRRPRAISRGSLKGKASRSGGIPELLAGESFRERIIQELKACKAAIVIWTPDSVHSDYVLSEAERARVARKLIQLRTPDLEPDELPPPFDTMHAPLIDDQKAIYGSLGEAWRTPRRQDDLGRLTPVIQLA
jgi:hypothetical protein